MIVSCNNFSLEVGLKWKKRESLANKVAWISVISNIFLTIGKKFVGWYGKSDAVFADGIHSAADVFASVIVLLVIKIATCRPGASLWAWKSRNHCFRNCRDCFTYRIFLCGI